MTFEEFKEKVDAVYSKITPDELIAELEELGYPLECFEEEPREKYPFYVHFVKECFEEELREEEHPFSVHFSEKTQDNHIQKPFSFETHQSAVKNMPSSFRKEIADCYHLPLAA